MEQLNQLFERIVERSSVDLKTFNYDVASSSRDLISKGQMVKFYGFYGVSPNHPLNFHFTRSSLAGTYFLGKCRVADSILYKSDIRGDELKKKGETLRVGDKDMTVAEDEEIDIENSFLIKTLVHNFSHDPDSLEKFFIKDTIATHYANIHGAPVFGCFMEPFSTVDLTTARNCVIGRFSYVQAGEIESLNIRPGTVWVRAKDAFEFRYEHDIDELNDYIYFEPGRLPQGLFLDFMEDRKTAFQRIFETVHLDEVKWVPDSASLDRYALIKPRTQIGENVLVAQRAFIQNSRLGKGANAQENCFIINSVLEGNDVTAHGGKIIEAHLDRDVFVGFNSFLRGRPNFRLEIGKGCVIMPHTIIDIRKPLSIPDRHIVWGMVRNQEELERHSMPIAELRKVKTEVSKGNMSFKGDGEVFVNAFKDRIHHILEANGAFFEDAGAEDAEPKYRGHAQKNQSISFNTIQPYPEGDLEGLYPTIRISP
ncbi:Transferase [Candidatus Desulfarcum epimagneticum]|uniref:Transferase n=1 Tax=uncultured Desulfobacteraceae bacterium TaxID=218296 RepID=A0A484HIP5_9BACT|nr:Transferase [uncultured Desulfobacteraceae bacterium]